MLLEEKEARVAGYRVNSQYVSPVQDFLAPPTALSSTGNGALPTGNTGGKRKMAVGRWKDQKIKIRKRRKERRSVQGKKDEGGKERLRRNEKTDKKEGRKKTSCQINKQ